MLTHHERRKNEGDAKEQLRRSKSSLGGVSVFSRHWRTRQEAMIAVNQDEADRSIGRVLKAVGGAFLEQLVFIGDRLALCKVFRWLRDEARRNAMIRELNLLSDYCLDDIGIGRRYVDLRTDDLVKRLRAGG